jgi:hypothetical protein
MPTLLVLLHSPLAGPVTWQATADALRLLGHPVVTPVLTGAFRTGPPHYAQLAEQAATQIRAAGGADASAMVLVGG